MSRFLAAVGLITVTTYAAQAGLTRPVSIWMSANVMAFVLAIVGLQALASRRWLLMGIAFGVVLLSTSRAVLLGLIAALVIRWISHRAGALAAEGNSHRAGALAAEGISHRAGALVAGGLLAGGLAVGTIQRGMSSRFDYWRVLLASWSSSPVLGHGRGASGQIMADTFGQPHGHSIYLIVLHDAGALGAILLAGALILLAWFARRNPSALALLALVAVSQAFDFYLWYWPVLPVLAAAALVDLPLPRLAAADLFLFVLLPVLAIAVWRPSWELVTVAAFAWSLVPVLIATKKEYVMYDQRIGEERGPVLERIIKDKGHDALVRVFGPSGGYDILPADEVESFIRRHYDHFDQDSVGISLVTDREFPY